MFQWPVDEGFSKSCHRHVRRVAFGVPRMRARKLAWVSRGFLDAGNGYRSQKTPRPCVHSLPNPTSPSHPLGHLESLRSSSGKAGVRAAVGVGRA